ncbi:MAG: transposase, partial [Planctomycetota bacterium]|nr:transposase [Planctomycetota bacterium]
SYTRFPKLSVLVDCDNHMILSVLVGAGPKPDINDLQGLLSGLPSGVTIQTLLADAGYDSEPNHKYLREEHGIRSVIPAKHGRPRKDGGPPSGRWRAVMHHLLRTKRKRKRSGYTQRWQVETVMSMIKRNQGEELSGEGYHSRNRQMRMLAVVHNILVCYLFGRFATEQDKSL